MKIKLLAFILPLLLTSCLSQMPQQALNIPQAIGIQKSNLNQKNNQNLTPFHSTALLKVSAGKPRAQAMVALKQLAQATRKELGNLSFRVQIVKKDPNTVLIWEQFKTEADFKLHLKSPHLQTFLSQKWTEFINGYGAFKKGNHLSNVRKGYFSTAILKLKNPKELVEARKAFQTLEAFSRQESGNLSFIVQEVQNSSPATFVIWEQFINEAAFQKHLQSKHMASFLKGDQLEFVTGYATMPLL